MPAFQQITIRNNLYGRLDKTQTTCHGKNCNKHFNIGSTVIRHQGSQPKHNTYYCQECYNSLYIDI